MYASPGGDLLFENCMFANHSSSADSLFEMHNSKLKMIDSVVDNNKMGIRGGIIQATTSIVTIQRCQFLHNSGRFGALFFLSRMSKLTIETSTFAEQ